MNTGKPRSIRLKWPEQRDPQSQAESKESVIEKAGPGQICIPGGIPAHPTHPFRWEHQEPGENRCGQPLRDRNQRICRNMGDF